MGFEFGEDQIRSIGAYLRMIRERREISLEEVAEATKIHLRFLKAIEDDEEELFPDPPYRDLFIKSYAEFLGVPAEEVMLRLPEKRPKTHRERRSKAAARGKKEVEGKKAEEEDAESKKKAGPRPWSIWLPIAGGLLVILLVVLYFAFRGDGQQPSQGPVRVDTSAAAIADQAWQRPVTEVPDSLFLVLIAERESWLDVRVDGESTYSAMLNANDTARFALQDSVYFKLGNAGAVSGRLNGMPLRIPDFGDSVTADFFITTEDFESFIDSSRIVE